MKDSGKTTSSLQKRPHRRIVKVVLIALLVLIFLAVAAIGGVSFYFSNAILEVIHYTPTYAITVDAVGAKVITLQRNSSTLAPGVFEIEWPAGQAIVGPILSSNASTVTRQFMQTTGSLAPGTKVYWNRRVYAGKFMDSLGLTINNVQIPDPLGPMPAWYVAGKLSTWAILVHGRGVTREETCAFFNHWHISACPCLPFRIAMISVPRPAPTATIISAIPSGKTWKPVSSTRWPTARNTWYSTAGHKEGPSLKPSCIAHPIHHISRPLCSMPRFSTCVRRSRSRPRCFQYQDLSTLLRKRLPPYAVVSISMRSINCNCLSLPFPSCSFTVKVIRRRRLELAMLLRKPILLLSHTFAFHIRTILKPGIQTRKPTMLN